MLFKTWGGLVAIKDQEGKDSQTRFRQSFSAYVVAGVTLIKDLSQRRESLVQRVVPAWLFSGLAEIADFC